MIVRGKRFYNSKVFKITIFHRKRLKKNFIWLTNARCLEKKLKERPEISSKQIVTKYSLNNILLFLKFSLTSNLKWPFLFFRTLFANNTIVIVFCVVICFYITESPGR